MAFIARHSENPNRIFFYQILKNEGNELILELSSNTSIPKEGELYELILTENKNYKHVLGQILQKEANIVKARVIKENIKKRKFFRIYIKKHTIPVGILFIKEKTRKPIVGVLKDFSLGGFKIQLSKKYFHIFENIVKQLNFDQRIVKAIFRLPFDREKVPVNIVEVDASIIRIDPKDCSVAFVFTFNSKNDKVLDLYKILLKEEKD